MRRLLDSRKALIALAIIVAFVAIVVPTCRMVGCDMASMGGARPFGMQMVAGFFGSCGGELAQHAAPTAVVPSGADSLTIALLSAVFAAMLMFAPRPEARLVRVRSEAQPPPPDDPLGERFRV